jgi:hypothetical protein
MMGLRRHDLDYQFRAREALIQADEYIRKKDLQVNGNTNSILQYY